MVSERCLLPTISRESTSNGFATGGPHSPCSSVATWLRRCLRAGWPTRGTDCGPSFAARGLPCLWSESRPPERAPRPGGRSIANCSSRRLAPPTCCCCTSPRGGNWPAASTRRPAKPDDDTGEAHRKSRGGSVRIRRPGMSSKSAGFNVHSTASRRMAQAAMARSNSRPRGRLTFAYSSAATVASR